MKIEDLKFDERGLIPAVVQDARTGEVLMLAYMNAESLRRTIEEEEAWFWSRSRACLWHKGATSGNTQRVVALRADCDADALVLSVEPRGAACHTGARTCFHHGIEATWHKKTREGDDETTDAGAENEPHSLSSLLEKLYAVIQTRRDERPEKSYTTYLFDQGLDKILKKLGEESAETIIAAKNDDPSRLVEETSDLIYHLLVLLVERGVTLDMLVAELARRGERRNNA